MTRQHLINRYRFQAGGCWFVVVILAAVAPCNAETSRIDLDVHLSGDWADTTYYEAGTWNNSGATFHATDAGSTSAHVEFTAERVRPIIDPWPFPIDPYFSTIDVPIGLSSAHDTSLSIRADARNESYERHDYYPGDDIEGYARILHLTPLTDMTVEVRIDYYMRNVGSIYWVFPRLFDETISKPINLLPGEAQQYKPSLWNHTETGTDYFHIPVQAGIPYTLEVRYDIYPAFLPEPGTFIFASAGLPGILFRRR